MRSTAVVGVLLIALALATLVYQGIAYRSGETVVDIGPVHATAADRQTTLPRPPLLGIVAAAGGVALLVIGRRKDA